MSRKLTTVLLLGCFLCPLSTEAQQSVRPVSFNREIRPLLVDKCYACHGPDAETVAGGLRVDIREEAIDAGAIEPGSPEESELINRIFSDDKDVLMPPPSSHKELSHEERELLKKWIKEGAEYQRHWSYTKLAAPPTPQLESESKDHWAHRWPVNLVDRFVADKLIQAAVTPNEPADRITLIRRLSFDLTGLPPTLSEVQDFVKDQSPEAYEKLVDRLLASPRFGERMAIHWLDLVRYADTVGYHGDQDVSQTPYRDYVINAFNSNMPFDQFVREQLAGDLLPNPTIDQLVASGYNRLNQTTEEGGAQPKEYLEIYFADRVRNASQVFMGSTIGCAQCHDHKFDPFTAKDFYSFGAFFSDIQEQGKYDARRRPPMIPVPTTKQKEALDVLNKRIARKKEALNSLIDEFIAKQDEWEKAVVADVEMAPKQIEHIWINDQPDSSGQISGQWNFVESSEAPVLHGKKSRRQESERLVQHYFVNSKKKVRVEAGTVFYAWVYLDPENPPSAIMLQLNNGNWDHRGVWGSDEIKFGLRPKNWPGYFRIGGQPKTGEWLRLEVNARDVGLTPGSEVNGMAFTQFGGLVFWDAAGWIEESGLPKHIAEAIAVSPDRRTEQQANQIKDFYLASDESILKGRKELDQLNAHRNDLLKTVTQTVITKSVKPRTIRVLHRGDWMDNDGEIVQPAIPAFLGKLDTGDRRATRLDLASWLCQPDNVLTSRTFVNRIWALLFGRGICASVDDLGGQGTFPVNPELLDWLAVDFVRSGWDIKHTIRTIVLSSTYRQSSKPTRQMLEKDPYNELFARQGRFRIDAEMVRDSALMISGLLVEEIGGESVKPYQPEGYYSQLNFPIRTYKADEGEAQYRRGVYTHWQRTFLHPMLKAFDAPSREEGVCSRSRSNTPLQALTLLNDPTFIEAARVYAQRIINEGGASTNERIKWAYQNAISREPSSAIVAQLESVFRLHLAQFKENRPSARKLIAIGQAPVASKLDASELAAWTSVARIILNLHELNTRY